MTNETCSTCRFWQRDSMGVDKAVIGECRRRSPALVVITERGNQITATRFPETIDDEWCGEWEGKGVQSITMERCDFNAKKLPVGLLYMFSRNAAGEKWYGFRINDDGFASGVCSNAQSGPLAICHAILKATRQEVRNDT